ncbi:helix-hairpin-helix domain-containing protein [bacterium]|nr:helix-hairpin-helix domain-containing protein [bacterium]
MEKSNSPKIDINSASEEELKELPGINIILAKKIIKRREETGGFKNFNEFVNYTKVTDDIQKQLFPVIIFKEMEKKKNKKSDERNLDI